MDLLAADRKGVEAPGDMLIDMVDAPRLILIEGKLERNALSWDEIAEDEEIHLT